LGRAEQPCCTGCASTCTSHAVAPYCAYHLGGGRGGCWTCVARRAGTSTGWRRESSRRTVQASGAGHAACARSRVVLAQATLQPTYSRRRGTSATRVTRLTTYKTRNGEKIASKQRHLRLTQCALRSTYLNCQRRHVAHSNTLHRRHCTQHSPYGSSVTVHCRVRVR
jgi:hypothetical protein